MGRQAYLAKIAFVCDTTPVNSASGGFNVLTRD
jgi:hypothetical protein